MRLDWRSAPAWALRWRGAGPALDFESFSRESPFMAAASTANPQRLLGALQRGLEPKLSAKGTFVTAAGQTTVLSTLFPTITACSNP
jgi:hypothetical protein